MSEDNAKSLEQHQQQGAESRAAAKIQAGFRGYRVRKRLQEERGKQAEAPTGVEARKPAQVLLEQKELEEEGEELQERMESPRDGSSSLLEDESATKIQAGVRGFLVRKRQQAEQAAATRIQAGFRGFRARKLLKHQQAVQ